MPMTSNILNDADQIKAILVKTKGTIAQKLLAILDAAGLDDVAELAGLLEVTERYVRKTRNQSSVCGTGVPEPEFHSWNQSSEIRNQSSAAKKVSPTPPSKNNTSLKLLPVEQEPRAPDRQDGFAECKEAFNGSTERMLAVVMAGMGGERDRKCATQWLKTLLDINGQHAVAQSFQMLETARIKGDVITDPIRWWSKTAGTLKGKAPKSVENIYAEQTKGVARFVRPAPGSERMPAEVARA